MTKRPWMPLYVGDFMGDTAHLSAAETGAYLMLIMHYWRMGGLPEDDRSKQRISRMTPQEWARYKSRIKEFFTDDWTHVRIEIEIANSEKLSRVRANVGSVGGRAKALKNKVPSLANATILPEQTASKIVAKTQSQSQESETTSLVIAPPPAPPITIPNDNTVISFERKPNPERAKTIQRMGDWWNQLACSLALTQIERIEGAREVAVLSRAKRLAEDFGDLEAGLSALEARIRGSPFLQGRTGWRGCKFDWVLKAANFQKILEGNYDAENRQARRV